MIKIAHYAELDANNTVTQVFVGKDESDTSYNWEQYYAVPGRTVKRTSYNTIGGVHYTNGEPSEDQTKAFRKNYAGIGFTYDEERDAFIPPKPYDSWILNEETCLWDSPVPYPEDGAVYVWDEENTSWITTED